MCVLLGFPLLYMCAIVSRTLLTIPPINHRNATIIRQYVSHSYLLHRRAVGERSLLHIKLLGNIPSPYPLSIMVNFRLYWHHDVRMDGIHMKNWQMINYLIIIPEISTILQKTDEKLPLSIIVGWSWKT